MRRSVLLLAVLGLMAPVALAQRDTRTSLQDEIDFARTKVYPALVNIGVVVQDYSGGRASRFPAGGSGVIVSPNGHVLTNYHVAGETTRIVCTLPSGEVIPGIVVGHDPLTDLSVLQLELQSRKDPNVPIPFATLGDSEALQVGDYVLAMGNPLMLSSSMTLGIVSNPKRVFTDFTGSQLQELDLGEGQKTGLFTRWIQHDALILPGNSGGPLVNLRGEVVGINELGGSGVGFAIPSTLAAQVLNQILTYGEVRRGWIGVAVIPVDRLGLETGAMVSSIIPGSPGEKAGLQPGDILLSLGGEPVTVRFFEQVPEFYQRIAKLPPGRETEVTYFRAAPEAAPADSVNGAGDRLTGTLEVERMEAFLGAEEEERSLGISMRDITPPMALARRYPDDKGVLITGVRPGFPAEEAKPALRRGDVIIALDGEPVAELAALKELLEEASGQTEVVVRFRRELADLLTVVEREEDEEEDLVGGELPKPWLGLETQVLTLPVARALGHEGTKGFRVTRVYPTTEAAKAGLAQGDLITAMNGTPFRAYRPQDARDLKRAVEDEVVGAEATFSILRNGELLELVVILQETPATAAEVEDYSEESMEFSAREMTFMDRIKRNWAPELAGILVSSVVSGGWAHMAGLREGDLIRRVEGQPVPGVEELEQVMEQVYEEAPERIRMFIQRRHRTHFVFLEPDWSKVEREEEESD